MIEGLGAAGRSLKVLFVHPSYPSTFDSVVHALAPRSTIDCSVLLCNEDRARVAHPSAACLRQCRAICSWVANQTSSWPTMWSISSSRIAIRERCPIT